MQLIEGTTKIDLVVEQLRDAILSGTLAPGQELKQSELAERLGTSSTPIREALGRLEAEGLIERTPHKTARVTAADPKQIREIYHIRKLLEGLATRWATPNLTDEDFDTLERLQSSMEAAVTANKPELFKDYNYRFHFQIYRRAGAATLLDMIRRLWPRYFWPHFPWDAWRMVPGYASGTVRDHAGILAALRHRDGAGAQELMEKHIEWGAQTVLTYLDTSGIPEGDPTRNSS